MSNTNIKKVRTSDLELKDRLVSIQRVTKVTKGGRTFSFSAIVVVGNEDGVVGYGLGKASEVQSAIAKGVEDAKKNLVKIPVINGTIPHKQESRYSGSLVMIRPAAPGTGVIAGGAMRAVLESVGIKNVLAKSKGSSNPHNLVKATITQVKSRIGSTERQCKNLDALGLKRINASVEHDDSVIIKGMIARVKHLVKVEEVAPAKKAAPKAKKAEVKEEAAQAAE